MTTPIWCGPYFAASLLLAAGGAMKLFRPHSTSRALRSAGLPHSSAAVRIGSAAEVVIALTAIIVGGTVPAVCVAASYLGFGAFILLVYRRGGIVSSCGCFGEVDSPPTVLHLVLNVGAAVTAIIAATNDAPGIGQALQGNFIETALLCTLSITLAYLAYLALAVLPKTMNTATT
jgi:hypothetical protein